MAREGLRARKPVDFSNGGVNLKRKSIDDVPQPQARPAKKAKRKNATRRKGEEQRDWTDNEDIQGLLWTHFPHIIADIPYFHIDNDAVKGKTLKTRVAFIPAGKLLWEEDSLFQGFTDWRKGANQGESRQGYEDRIQATLWNDWPEEGIKRSIFANFSILQERDGDEHNFFGDSKAARIDANAGGDEDAGDGMVVAYTYLNFLSHSCRPNCRITDRGYRAKPRWQLRTLVPIREQGTDLTIDYDDLPRSPDVVIEEKEIGYMLNTVIERQAQNDEAYQFQCTCEACEDPEASDRARDEIGKLRVKLMATLPAEVTLAQWKRRAKDCDIDMERYIDLCKAQHLFPMALQAHERAVVVYTNLNRVKKKTGEEEISRSDRVRVKEHSFGQAEMRRLLYGLWDPELEDLLNRVVEPLRGAREAREAEAEEEEE